MRPFETFIFNVTNDAFLRCVVRQRYRDCSSTAHVFKGTAGSTARPELTSIRCADRILQSALMGFNYLLLFLAGSYNSTRGSGLGAAAGFSCTGASLRSSLTSRRGAGLTSRGGGGGADASMRGMVRLSSG